MDTILVPVDGSEHATKAVILAGDLAQKYDARVVLLHVLLRGELPETLKRLAEVEYNVPPKSPTGIPRFGFAEDQAVPMDMLQAIGAQVLAHAERVAKEHGARNVETILDLGAPAKSIIGQAKRLGADMIVMGSRGLSDVRGLLQGSVSHKVGHSAACTCVTVR